MALQLTTNQVWEEIENEVFAVIGMVTAKNEARTVGIAYAVRDRRMYFGSDKDAWKVRHISANPNVSVTIPIAKRVPFMPWLNIPAATITFRGLARALDIEETPAELWQAVYEGNAEHHERKASYCLIEVTPQKDFLTYGVGVSLRQMRDPEKARARTPVNGAPRTHSEIKTPTN